MTETTRQKQNRIVLEMTQARRSIVLMTERVGLCWVLWDCCVKPEQFEHVARV